jgi:coenzyme F420-reducing hydrogenase delta subunit/Pyruvate/2-oxoacid:ferredoxin oxidoreductase delta subunit
LADGRIQIDYWDETTRMDFRLVADRVIVDERVMPHPRLANIIQRLGLEMDALGYAQGDNIHRLPNLTNRRGIFTAGGARGMLTQAELLTDADQAALSVIEFFSDVDRGSLPGVEIDPGRCARCLTCYRLCPYAAIEMEPRMTIISAACQSCGLCAAGCPNRAIRIDNPALEKAFDIMAGQEGAADEGDTLFVPKIMAFCCTRSAAQARDLAQRLGHRLPAGLRFVEGVCGGTFSVHHLLSAIEAGMDGVLVLTCHEGNCHSEHGTLAARQRVLEATRLLTWAGIGSERLQFTTLAANMGSEFARVVNGFEETIKTLGPVIG